MKIKINGKEALVGSLSREASEENLGQTLSFDALTLYYPGDKVKVYDDGKLKYSGIIIEVGKNVTPPHTYKVQDYSFNLKSEHHVQIKDRADSAIKNTCKRFGISCKVCSIPTKIKKIYPDMALSEIFKSILKTAEKEQGKEYFMEVDGGALVIEEKEKEKVKASFLVSDEATLTKSIEERKNSIKIVSDEEKSTKVYASAKDEKAIKRYGLLQVVETIEEGKKSKAETIAKTKLAALNKTRYSMPIRILVHQGAWDIKPNRLIKTPVDGKWHKIKSLTHTIEDGIDTMDITLEWKK